MNRPFFAPLLCCLLACGFSRARAQAVPGSGKFDIDRCINTFMPAGVELTAAGYQYWFADSTFLDGRTIKLSVVRPHGATHPPHRHAEDEFFFVLEGRAEFFLDGHTRIVTPLTSLYCPSFVMHGIRNVGDHELKYLVIKKYNLVPTVASASGAPGDLANGQRVSAPAGAPVRDTSFTTWSAWQGLHDRYPLASPARVPPSAAVRVHEGVVYAADGGRRLLLDIYMPVGTTPGVHPGVLIIHGGGWRSGDRMQEAPMAMALAMHGYVAVTADYRLSPESRYPTGVYDLKAALRWMHAHAPEFAIDPLHIATLGGSAGGTLAALLGVTGENEVFEGDGGSPGYSSAVQAVVDIDGIVDFTDSAESGKDWDPAKPSAGKLWFGGTFRDRPDLWRQASPVNWVSPAEPPIMFINSSLPRFHAGRDAMVTRLRSLGIVAEVHTLPNTPHPFWLFDPWFEETRSLVVAFLDGTFQGSPGRAK